MAKRQVPPSRRGRGASFQIEELEHRLLFSADAATLLGLPVSLAAPAEPARAQEADVAAASSIPVMQAVVNAPATPQSSARHELVFVDASVPEADKLIAGIKADATPDKVIEVVVIQAGEDGLAVITKALQQRQDLDAVHIISHGDATGLTIGSSRLDANALDARLGEFASWGAALSPDADLMLYGCDLTSSAQGQALADNLALLTGADVAASNDLTGAAALGGNWVMEYHRGQIESDVIVDAGLAASWNHTLATTSFQDGTGGYTSTKDTYLELLGPGNNNSASATLSAGRATTQNGFQTLVKFEDIIGAAAGQIPQGSVITNVTLTMYMTSSPTFTNPTFSLYRMLAAWSDTSTYSSMGSGIDGAEYRSSADQTITDSGAKSYTFASNAAMIATVQAWVNDPSSNQGWYLFCDDNSSQASFASSENGTVANRPKLSVTYTPPTPQTIDLDANNSSGATGNNYNGGFTEQTPVKIADTDATISGGSTTSLTSMAVTLANPLDGALESLSATTTGTSINASYNSGTGVLTLSGTDTIANYQTVLRSITYNNTSDNPTTTSRTINVVGTDTNGVATATATTTLAVTRVNDAPVITSNGGGTSASVSVRETLTAVTTVTATDVDSASLTYSIAGGADAGKFTINSTTGVLTFTSAPDFEAPTDVGGNNVYDVIVQVSDGSLTDTQAIAVTVLDVVSTLTVTTIADTNDSGLGTSFTAEQLNALNGGGDGKVSLREAIIAANTQAGLDTINFAITGTAGTYGEYTITLSSTLPSITGAVYLNAASQTGYNNRPLIVLDGNGGNGDGLYLSNTADGSTIRGLVIRAFSANGIYVQAGSDGNTIVGNYIGSFNADGSNAGSTKRNSSEGIESYGANLTIGGTTAADRNVISGNASAYNIYLASGADGSVIKGNYIGLNAAGNATFNTNSAYGVMVESSSTNVTIGGTAAGAGNVISGFTTRGVWVTTTGTTTVQGNYIGTDATGTADLGNTEYGLYVDDSGTVVIGGTTAGAGNLVSGNNGGGIYVGNTGGATIQGNIVGLNAAGTAALGNTGVGIYVATSNASTIGGNTAAARNIISGNSSHGIQVTSSPASGHVIKGNYIGVGANGTTLLGNGGAGVYLASSNTVVGGKGVGDGNIIAGNGGAGIAVASGNGNLFYRNSIHGNTGLGIDLGNDGVTANDYNDGDGGANYLNNFPVITSVVTSNGSTTIQGSIEWYNQSQPIYIEFFSSPTKDASGYGEGKTYIGHVQVTTDATTGDATFSVTLSGVSVGDWITAVANVEGGPLGASEFAMAVQAVSPANAPRGKVIWNANDRYYQSYADWGPGGWSGVGTTGLNLTDDISMILAAESPTRNEIIFIGSADVSGKILAAIWNGSTWSSVLTLPLANPAAAAAKYDSFAIAYDSLTGNAMLVWDNGDNGTSGLSYATWDGSTWSSVNTVAAPVGGEPQHMKLVASPTTREMILAVSTTAASNNQYAMVWNGTSWGNVQTLGTNSSQQMFEMNVAYEQLSGRAMVVYDASSSNSSSVQYRVWNGSSWSAESTIAAPVGVTATSDVYSTVLASDAKSNRLAIAVQDAANEVWLSVWDGSSWGNSLLATANGTDMTENHSGMAVAFESQSGDLLAAYGKQATANVFYRTWTSGGGWSSELTGPSLGGTDKPQVLKLFSDPYTNTIMMGVQDDAQDLNFVAWDGSAWGSVTQLDSDTGQTYRENFTYVWYQTAPSITNLAGDTLAYNEDQAATVIDQGSAAVANANGNLSYNGGNLTVSFAAGGVGAEDILGVRNQGVGAGQIGVSGGNITYAGTLIGTFTGGTGGNPLVITLNGNATDAAVSALINNVTYQNTNTTTPSTANRTVRFVLTNESGQSSLNNDVTVTVAAVNDAPVNTVPGAQATNEDTALVFSSGNGNLISIGDVDAASGSLQVTLSVLNGTLTLSGTAGLSFTTGDGTADGTMVFTGTIANINAALAGMSYTPNANHSGSDTLSITTSDQGNTGSGGAKTDMDTVAITVNAVNDAPTANITQPSYSATEQVALNLHGTGLSIADVDAGSSTVQATLSVGSGALTVAAGSTGVAVSGSGTATVTLTGTLAQINALLAGTGGATATYLQSSDTPPASTTLTLGVNDQGNTGSGGAKSGSSNVTINITAVNDAPVNTVPGAQATNEDTALVFSSGNSNLISIADVDAASGSMQVTLSVLNGTLTLSRITGLSFTTGDGTADGTMVFTGTIANINAALAGMSYTPTGNYNGSDTLSITTSDQGNTGSGGARTDTDTVAITVNAVNDAPVNTVPAAQSTNEDTALVFSSANSNLISIADVDAASGSMRITLGVLNGTLTLSRITGLSFTTGDGTADANMVFTGTIANINAALAGMSYTPTGNYNGSDTLSITTSDQGNTGSGGTLTDTDTVAITVNAVNDAPVNTVPGAQSTNEDTALVFSSGNGNLISIADVDAASGSMRITLGVLNGTLTLSRTTGLSFTTGDGTADGTMVFTGTIANINAALAGMSYTPTGNYNGSDTLSITTSDQGNTGSGGTLTDTDTVAITVNAVNDAPVNTVPAAQSTNEDTALVFSSANSNLISIADVDAASGSMRITLGVLNGTLTLSRTTGLSFTTGDGTADGSMVFTGTIANINAALAGISYTPTGNYNGSDTLSITTSDQGNTGSGGTLTDTDTVAITVNAVNDAPVNTVPAAQSTNEDTALVFSSANSNLISIADVDAASGSMRITLGVLNGTLTLSRTTGLSFTTGDGTADGTMVFTGTIANINAALAGMSYTPTGNYNGSDTLSITTSDQGNTGSGGAKTDTDTVAITVNAVNDAPVNTVPAAQSTNEDTALVFSSANSNLISIADVDAASGSMRITLGVLNGTLTLSRTTGLSFTTGDGTADANMVFTGTIANINAALAGMSYTPTGNYNGSDTLSITTSDQGNTGSGGTLTDTDTVAITVNAVNDAPVNTVPGAQSTNEDTALVFSSANSNLISIADVDAASGSMRITLGVLNGTLTLSRTTGLSFTTGDGTADGSMVFTGTIANINAALAGMSYTPTGNYNGSDTLSITTSDQGNTGAGGTLTDTDTVAITVNAVNDAPTASIAQPSYSANEQVALNLHGTGLSIADVDAASGTVQATLSVVSGTLTVLAGSTGVAVVGSGTATVTLTGTLAQINALLAGTGGATATYLQNSDTPPASDTLTLGVNDQGNTGSGGTKSGSANVAINVTAVNDAPVAGITQPNYTATYLTNLTLSGTGISIGDVDAGSATVQATLNVTLGLITVVAGSTGVTVGGSGTDTVTLTGTLTQINNLLSGASGGSVKYLNNSGTPLASSTLTLDVSDLGNSGTGGTQTDSTSVTIDVLQTAPVDTMIVPGIHQSDIDAFYAFNAAANLGRDDANHGNTLTLTGSHGQTADNTAFQSALALTGGSGEILGLQTGGALTIAGWVRFDSTGTGESMIDFGDANNSGIGNIVIGRSASTGDLQFLIDTPGNPQSVTATGAIVNGQWMHVAATVDGSGLMSLYVNGTLVGTAQGTVPVAGVRSHNLVGASNTAGNSLLDGAVDDLLIARKALTAEQIATLYDQSAGLSVPERSANGTVVGTVMDSSAVGANTVSYSLVNTAGGRFAIDATTGVITVANGSLLNHEQAQSHTITVRATDSGGQALDTSYVVNLVDLNQAPQGADKTISATEDTAYTFTTSDFGFSDNNDSPSNSLLSVKITSLPASGSLTLNGVAVNVGDFVMASDIAAGKLQFIADADDNGAAYASIGFQVRDDGGTVDGGIDLDPVTRTLTIDVAAVNDVPMAVITPPTYSATEQVTLTLEGTGLSIADVDAGSAQVQATLSVVSGILTVNAGGTGVLVSGSATSTVTLSGTLAQINDLLAGNLGATVGYVIASDTPPASDTLALSVSDLGNAGSGGTLVASDTAAINITAVNDAPINTVPGTQTIDEDGTLVFSSGHGNLITVSDVDAGSANLQVTLSVVHGTLTLSGANGLVFTTGDGSADATMVFTGTVADINAALAGLSYTPTANHHGTDTLSITTSDQGNTGTGGALLDASSVTINLDAVNDAPVNTVPGAQSINEDSSLTFSSGNGNLISIADVDAGSGELQISLSVAQGHLTLSGVTGLTFLGGDGVADATMVFRGTVADINAALAGLVYAPTGNFNGADMLTLATSDLGNTGTGGTLVDSDTVAITVNAVNDAPVNTVPDAQTTDEDTNLVFSTVNGNRIAIADVDAGSGNLQVTLSVLHGSLSLSGTTGLLFTTGDGSGDASMVFTGTLADINAALEGLVYTPGGDYHGADTLSLLTSDLGNTGSGGTLLASSTVALTVDSVNDVPVNHLPAAQSTNEDMALVFSSGNGNLIWISDADAAAGSMQVTLSVLHGSLSLSGVSGLGFISGDGSADATMVFTGTLADINAALAGLSYTPTGDDNGADTLSITTSDLGNTGNGGPRSATNNLAITVNAVNDAPVNTVPAAQSTDEDTPIVFSSVNGNLIAVGDVDAGASGLQVTLSVAHGSLSLASLTGLSFITGDGVGDATLVFTGTVADINAALLGLSYTPTSHHNGSDTLSITTSDLGNTGSGGVLTDSGTVAITVHAVNDAPVNAVPGAQSTNEDTALVFSSGNGNLISVSDVDAASGNLQLTLSVLHGALSLSGLAGLSFVTGDGVGDATMVFTGSVSAINAALAGLSYTPTGDYNGADTLSITTSDLGNTGTGGTLTDTDTVAITVNAVNDAPANTVPGAQSTNEDTALVFSSGNGNLISVSDVDAASGNLQVTLNVLHGALSLSGLAGLSFITGDGVGDATMVFTGSISAINAALAGLSYTPAGDYNGADTLSITTSDLGNAGAGGTLTDTDTVAITVNAVNDAPTGGVSITGTPTQGQTLGANNNIADADGLGTITYHWLRNGVDTGSTGASYLLTEADVGALMSVRATYTDGGGTVETVNSADTATVANVNDLPAGGVTITGTPTQGQTLSANHNITDADGLGAITYHWLRDGVDTGSTGSTYLLTEADVDAVMSVRATYTDGHGASEAVTSADTAPVANVNDLPTGSVAITGTPTEGQTLTASDNLADLDGLGGITYHWLRNGVDTGSTGGTYLLTDADVGAVITVRASYTDGHGTPEAVDSLPTATVANVNDPVVGSVTISGTPTQGQTLGASDNITDADGLGAITYHWLRNGVDTGSTGATYLLTEADVGAVMSVRATYTDGHGTAESATSAPTATVANVNDLPTGSVSITGTAAQGQTLTAGNSLADLDGLGTITYHWLRDGVDTGMTGGGYQLRQADVGSVISVRATYTDGHGTLEAVLSATVGPVTDANVAPTLGSGDLLVGANPSINLPSSFLLADAFDDDGDVLTVRLIGSVSHGQLTILADGSLQYRAADDFQGEDSFTYAAHDGQLQSTIRTVRITVAGSTVIVAPPTTPVQPPVSPGLPDFGTGTDPTPTTPPVTTPTKPTAPTTPATPTDPVEGGGTGEIPGNGDNAVTPGNGQDQGRGGSGSYRSSPDSFAGNQAGGFVFRLESGGMVPGMTPGNVLFRLLEGVAVGKTSSDPGLNLSFSPVSTQGSNHTAPTLAFTDTTEDRQVKVEKMVVQTSGAVLSIGAVWWAARMSGLLASLMISTPAWRSIDPLPVMGLGGDGPNGDEDDDHGDDPDGMDARAARLFGADQGRSRELEGIG